MLCTIRLLVRKCLRVSVFSIIIITFYINCILGCETNPYYRKVLSYQRDRIVLKLEDVSTDCSRIQYTKFTHCPYLTTSYDIKIFIFNRDTQKSNKLKLLKQSNNFFHNLFIDLLSLDRSGLLVQHNFRS